MAIILFILKYEKGIVFTGEGKPCNIPSLRTAVCLYISSNIVDIHGDVGSAALNRTVVARRKHREAVFTMLTGGRKTRGDALGIN